jgi:hypothetical protein
MSLAAGSCHPHPLWHKATRLLQNFSEINLFNLCWFCSTHTFLCVLPSSYLTLPISLKSLLPWYWKEPIQNMVQNIQSSCLDLSSSWSHHSSITEWSNAHCFSQRNQSYFGSKLMLLFYNELTTQSSNVIQPLNLLETNNLTYSSIIKTLGLST